MTLPLPWSAERREHRELARNVARFKAKLHAAKQQTAHKFGWYPYDSLGTWCRVHKMFGPRCRRLLRRVAGEPLLDAGCGDGDLSFFLESLGCRVHAIDWPATNHNGMRGVRALKAALASGVEIREVDLDSQFQIPVRYGGLALLLGVLYHLKNPFFVLEKLALHFRYCIFSTTVANFTPNRRLEVRDLPVAYLLDEGELNSDPTNHWIFSEAGLRRLVTKTNWEILDYATQGDTRKSVPDSVRHELRVFGILKSTKLSDPADGAELIEGWHALEQNRWRWTERCFGVRFDVPPRAAASYILRVEFRTHERLLAAVGRVGLTATANGIPLEAAEYRSAEVHVYEQRIEPAILREDGLIARFELDTAIQPDRSDPRERGLIVTAVTLEPA